MSELFYKGGPLLMSILTLLLVMMVVWTAYHLITGLNNSGKKRETVLRKLSYGKSIGLFALIFGIFYQLKGIYHAFTVLQEAGDISPSLVYAGIKISLIGTLYGIGIYLLSVILWLVASMMMEKKEL